MTYAVPCSSPTCRAWVETRSARPIVRPLCASCRRRDTAAQADGRRRTRDAADNRNNLDADTLDATTWKTLYPHGKRPRPGRGR
jgi:hypothetical protein